MQKTLSSCKRWYRFKNIHKPFSPKELWLRMEPYEAVRDSMRE